MNGRISFSEYMIDSFDKLNLLLTDRAIKFRFDRLKIDTSFMRVEESVLKTLNKYFYSCGCGTGARFVLIGLSIGIVCITATNSWTAKNTVLWIAACFLSGLLGKTVGLTYAKYKWKKIVRKLIQLSSSGNGM